MSLEFAITEFIVNKIAHGAQVIYALLKEETIDEASIPLAIWLNLCQVHPKALQLIDGLLEIVRLICSQDVCIECTKSDTCDDLILFSRFLLMPE